MNRPAANAASPAPPRPELSWFYRLVWLGSQAFFQVMGRVEVAGLENIPRTGPFLLTANHASFLDPPLLGCFLPRPLRYFARKTLWVGPLAWALDQLNCIPLDRDGDGDIAGFKRVFAALQAGEAVQVFPEGTRTPDGKFQPPRRGAGLLAARLGVPVVPAHVFGTYEMLNRRQIIPRPFYRLGVTYGKPLLPADYDPGPKHPERYETVVARIMDAIIALPPPWAHEKQSSME
jgi:1-acyl-sn-glycerol-3-phosphate acyltransferase